LQTYYNYVSIENKVEEDQIDQTSTERRIQNEKLEITKTAITAK
jgi:hypothetical protein